MNKLRTDFNGGMPNIWDNFRFFEGSVELTFAQLCKALAGFDTPLVLWGCKIEQNSTTYFCSEGAIYHQGIIYRVPQHSLSKLTAPFTGTYFWDVSVEQDPSGALLFQDQITRNCYEIRTARMAKTTSILEPGTFTPLFSPRLESFLTRRELFNEAEARLSELKSIVSYHNTQTGAAYFEYNHVGESVVYPDPVVIPFQLKIGVLASLDSHMLLQPGAVYQMTFSQSIETGLRLTGSGINQVLINQGIVKTPALTLGGNNPIAVNFRFSAAGNVKIAAILLGRDTSLDAETQFPTE